MDMKEFNLEESAATLKDAGIPMDKDNIRRLYDHTEDLLKKAGVRPLDIRPGSGRDASVVPEISLNVDVELATRESYVVSVYLTVSKWMSVWSGNRSVQAPAIVWWRKRVLMVPPSELTAKLDEAAVQLTGDFGAHFAVANPVSNTENQGGDSEDTETGASNGKTAAASPGNN
jgi:hypothetical protein